LVNEYIICDSSSDRTAQIIDRLKADYRLNIIHIVAQGEDIVKHSNIALSNARFRWILRWDADFVATDSMICRIRALTRTVNSNEYYVVYYPLIKLDCDIFHQIDKEQT